MLTPLQRQKQYCRNVAVVAAPLTGWIALCGRLRVTDLSDDGMGIIDGPGFDSDLRGGSLLTSPRRLQKTRCRLAELDVPRMQVVRVVRKDRGSEGNEVVVVMPSRNSTTKCEP